MNPLNDETPFRGPANIAAENVPRAPAGDRRATSTLGALLVLDETVTPLQRSLRALRRTLADARKMNERERITFAAVGARTFANRFGPELLLAEAERALEEAA